MQLWNFLVHPTTHKLVGIIDFEDSGFYPEYVEYAVAMTLTQHDKWWDTVLKESLDLCSKLRLRYQNLLASFGS